MTDQTHSERLFKEYLTKNGFSFSRPDEEDRNSKAADFLVMESGEPALVLELKEMSDNPDDLKWMKKWEEGCKEMHEILPRKRVRRLIEGARAQLKATQVQYPTVSLIPMLYSTIGSGRMDEDTMDPSLFGDRVSAPEGTWHWKDAHLQKNKNTFISGVGVIHGTYEVERITLYHNPFALVKISDIFSGAPLVENRFKSCDENNSLVVGFRDTKIC